MNPLRIVVVMVEPPLPFGSAPGRWYSVLLRGLVARGHRVTALAACPNPVDIEAAHALFSAPEYDLRLFTFPVRRGLKSKCETLVRPFSFMFSDGFKRTLGETLASGYDILHLEQHWSGWLGRRHAGRAVLNVHYLMGIDLAESRPKTPAEWQNWLLGFAAERRLIRSFPQIRVCTPRLESAVRALNPRAEVTTIPFALDTALYEFIADDRRKPAPTLSLIGSMHWPPSLSAARRLVTRLWPEIKRRVPAARLEIVGWNARSALGEFLGLHGVTVIENVPETRPHFEAASVFLYAPGRGSGMKIKVQEAMAYGVPVVTTREGIEGLPAEDGVHAGVCDDDDGLIDRTVALLGDVARQNRQRQAARRLIETHCAPGATLDALEGVYARMIQR